MNLSMVYFFHADQRPIAVSLVENTGVNLQQIHNNFVRTI